MGKSYRGYHPEQDFLLPPSLREWLPENHLVYFVSDVVDNLNLSALDAVYGDEQRGQPPYDPRMMTKAWVYGHCGGVFSSRRIERGVAEDGGCRSLAAAHAPTSRTTGDSPKLHRPTLAGRVEGGEGRKAARESGTGEARGQRAIQLHRSGIAPDEGQRWSGARLQRAGGSGAEVAVDRGAERDAGGQR